MDGNPSSTASSSDRGGVPRKKPRPRRRGGGGGGGRGGTGAVGGGDAAAPAGIVNHNNSSHANANGPPPPASSAPGGGRPRVGGRNKKKSHGAAANKPDGPHKSSSKGSAGPPVPQLKVLLRGIGGVDRYGTCEQLAHLLRSMVEGANQPATTTTTTPNNNTHLPLPPVVVDEASVQKAIEDEAAAQQAKAKWLESQDPTRDSAAALSQTNEEGEVAHSVVEDGTQLPPDLRDEPAPNQPPEPSSDATAAATAAVAGAIAAPPTLTSLKGPADRSTTSPPPLVSGPTIVAKVLYMAPPKKTRRRGDKPGCLYVVLHMPWESPSSASSSSSSSSAPTPPPAVPASSALHPSPREAAKRRHLLARLVEVWSITATNDARAGQVYAGMQVGDAPSGKTWKTLPLHTPQSPRGVGGKSTADRLDGTVWDTPDYKSFVDSQARAKEERMARPKPPPGGAFPAAPVPSASSSGGAAAAAGTTPAAVTSQPPVAALVRHMLAKHEAHKDRFKASAVVRRKPPPSKPPASSSLPKGPPPTKGPTAASAAAGAAAKGAAAAATSDSKASINRARRKKHAAAPGSANHLSKTSLGAEGTTATAKR